MGEEEEDGEGTFLFGNPVEFGVDDAVAARGAEDAGGDDFSEESLLIVAVAIVVADGEEATSSKTAVTALSLLSSTEDVAVEENTWPCL